MSLWIRIALAVPLLSLAHPAAGAPPGHRAVEAPDGGATVESTLETRADQIRQFAFDGDPETCFVSADNATDADHFTLRFPQPVAVTSIDVTSGRPGGEGEDENKKDDEEEAKDADRLEMGKLEVSADGETFEELATFQEGVAKASPAGRELKAIRIRPSADLGHPLAIREIKVESDPPVPVFAYPIEFRVDVSDAPELQDWVDMVARTCERAYPMINEELKSDGFRPPHQVTLTLRKDYRGVAAAGGRRITGSVDYFKDHPDDVGAMIHETVHIVQRYRARNNPSWLVEGVADYVRFFKYEPDNLGRIDPERARYNRSYRVSAAFLDYLARTYDSEIVRKLNTIMREGRYSEDAFQDLTGKPLPELGEEWRATLQDSD